MDDAGTTGEVFRLIYRSRDLIPAQRHRAELGELFTHARAKNKSLLVTGALLVSEDRFVQTLEGEEDVVRALLTRIEQDPRHDRVELLDASLVSGRAFPRWSMAEVAEDGQSDINLIAHQAGIARAASRGDTTSEQEGVLKVMRDAVRA